MSLLFPKIRGDKRKMAISLTIVFLVGWFSFAYYVFSNQILVVTIEGSITDFTATTMVLHQAKIDRNVKAVILYFNTPGGYAYPCLEIASYVAELKKFKPTIAVMGPICASGGYYIASFANYIYSHKNTLTGSIGVMQIWVDMSEYYKKQGINVTVWITSPEKDIGADWRSPTKEEYDKINATVYSIFGTLLSDIKQNRNISEDNLELIKTGATFTGEQAVQLGLADEIGDIITAVDEAIRITKLFMFIIVSPNMDEKQKFLRALF